MRATITFTRFWNQSTVQLGNIKWHSGVTPHRNVGDSQRELYFEQRSFTVVSGRDLGMK